MLSIGTQSTHTHTRTHTHTHTHIICAQTQQELNEYLIASQQQQLEAQAPLTHAPRGGAYMLMQHEQEASFAKQLRDQQMHQQWLDTAQILTRTLYSDLHSKIY